MESQSHSSLKRQPFFFPFHFFSEVIEGMFACEGKLLARICILPGNEGLG